jgi:hypothetical protein
MLDETYFRMPILPTPKSTGLAPIFIKSLSYSKRKDSLSTKRNSFDSNKNMFNFFLIIYILKDMVEDFMEFTPSSDPEIPITLRNINPVKNVPDKCSSNDELSVPNTINCNLSDSLIMDSSEAINSKIALKAPHIGEYSDLGALGNKNVNIQKNINTTTLSNTKNVSKANSSFKKKNHKKNKAQHPHSKRA